MIRAMQTLGVPYPEGFAEQANKDVIRQELEIKATLKSDKINTGQNKEIVALIAYLQRMGKDIKAAPKEQTTAANDGHAVMGN
jgi:cytochrome c oxidase cbb3-type subunit I/II